MFLSHSQFAILFWLLILVFVSCLMFHAFLNHALEDILARRTRLAFLNKEAALRSIPRVVELMAEELHWTPDQQQQEVVQCVQFMRHFGGPSPVEPISSTTRSTASVSFSSFQDKSQDEDSDDEEEERGHRYRYATNEDIRRVFILLETLNHGVSGAGTLDATHVSMAAEMLGCPLSRVALVDCMQRGHERNETTDDVKKINELIPGQVNLSQFINWWNSDRFNSGLQRADHKYSAHVDTPGSGTLFG